jgi:hypothetical protein
MNPVSAILPIIFHQQTMKLHVYKPNKPWNHPINGDADGNFRIYFQNPHSIPRDDVSSDHNLKALAEYDVSCYRFAETNLDWG